MKKGLTWLPMLIALPVILFLGWRFATDPSAAKHLNIGGKMPNFKLHDLYQNEVVTEKDFKGEWAVVNIWATWCTPCMKEHGVLMDISQQYPLPIYGINLKDDLDAAKQWLSEKGNPYAIVVVDDKGRSAFDWGAIGVPETILIDPSGIIQHRFAGQLTLDIWENEFVPLLPAELQK